MHKEFDNYEQQNDRSIQSDSHLEEIAEGDKRYIADDFKDSENSYSLWVGNGKENFFSTGGARKEKGDLITINVYKNLKDQITSELSRLYPGDTSAPTVDQANSKKPVEQAKNNEEKPNEIQDKISAVVSKEVRDNHLIITGRKQIIYNENRHLIEVQILVHRKDIATDDSLNSTKIIQSTIKVLR